MAFYIYIYLLYTYLYTVLHFANRFSAAHRPRCRPSVTEKMTNDRKGKFTRTRRENPRRCATRLLRRTLHGPCETIRKNIAVFKRSRSLSPACAIRFAYNIHYVIKMHKLLCVMDELRDRDWFPIRTFRPPRGPHRCSSVYAIFFLVLDFGLNSFWSSSSSGGKELWRSGVACYSSTIQQLAIGPGSTDEPIYSVS